MAEPDILASAREPASGPLSRWVRALLAVVVALALGGLWLHQRSAHSGTPTSPRPVAVPAKAPAVGASVAPDGVDARLLVLGSVPRSVDLRTGAVTVENGGPGTDAASVQQAISLAEGDVLLFARPAGGLVAYGVRPSQAAVRLGDATAAVDAGDGQSVWLIGPADPRGRTVVEVHLDGSQVGPTERLPTGQVPVAGWGGGQALLLQAGAGASERVLSWLPGGAADTVIAGGKLLAAAAYTAVVRTQRGALERFDLLTGSGPSTLLLPGRAVGPVVLSPDGLWVAVPVPAADRSGVGYVVQQLNGGYSTLVGGVQSAARPLQLAWTRQDALLLIDPASRRLSVVDPGTRSLRRLDVVLPEFASVLAY